MTEIGFIGVGRMGEPMARNLIAAGYKLRVFNRTREKAEKLAGPEAKVCASPAEAACDVTVSMVANDEALADVTAGPEGVLAALPGGGVHVVMSTVSPKTAAKLAKEHAAVGKNYVAAPVFGRPDAAAAKALHIAMAGPDGAKAKVRPVLEAMGKTVYDFGADAEKGNVVKLCGNFLILAAIESLAESLALGEKNGIGRELLARFFSETIFACLIYKGYGKRIAERDYDPAGFALDLGLKDSELIRQAAAESGVEMPYGDIVNAQLKESVARGRGGLDWAAVELLVAEASGLKAA